MIAKTYLGLVALLYFVLSIWCSVQPNVTSKKVGFDLNGGSGQSEFLAVYGGLEFGLALILAATIFRSETVNYGVWACVLVHASLVLFRTISLFAYSGIEPFTYKLAIGEWGIALLGIAILMWQSRS